MKLYEFQEFTNYCQINEIKKDSFRLACCVLRHRHIRKGDCLFYQGDIPDKFYGIIKGKISIRVKEQSKNKEETKNDDNSMEEERIVLLPGACFGEWALIYNTIRTASAYALEDTDLFYLDKDDFIFTLNKEIYKSDINKRHYVINKIPILKKIKKYSTILFSMIPCVNNIFIM